MVVVKLQPVSHKIGVDEMDTFLKNIFNNYIILKSIQRHKCVKTLQEVVIDPTELDMFTTRFGEKPGQLGQSHFTYYTRDIISLFKRQFHLIGLNQAWY